MFIGSGESVRIGSFCVLRTLSSLSGFSTLRVYAICERNTSVALLVFATNLIQIGVNVVSSFVFITSSRPHKTLVVSCVKPCDHDAHPICIVCVIFTVSWCVTRRVSVLILSDVWSRWLTDTSAVKVQKALSSEGMNCMLKLYWCTNCSGHIGTCLDNISRHSGHCNYTAENGSHA